MLRVSGPALSLDDALTQVRVDAEDGFHEPSHYYVENIDDRAVAALGFATRTGAPRHLCWLVTFRDGLLYRQRLYDSVGDAERAYHELGPDLGTA